MNPEDRAQLSQALGGRRDAIADAWYQVAAVAGPVPFKATQVRQRLVELAEGVITLLLADPFKPDQAQAIGAELAGLYQHESEPLGRTQEMLVRHLVEGLPADQVVALQARLPPLLGGLTAAFLRQARETILTEQETIRGALVAELRSAGEALRAAHEQLERRVKERTAELARVNEELQAEATERVRAERLLQTLNAAALAMQRVLTHEEIFAAVAEEFKKLGLSCMLFLTDESRSRLLTSYVSYEARALEAAERLVGLKQKEFSFPIEDGDLYSEVVRERKTVFVENLEDSLRQVLPGPVERFAGQLVRMLGVSKVIAAPLILEEDVIGVLSVQSDDLGEDDMPAITAFAHQIAAAWLKAQLLEQAQQEIVERRQAEEALRESEERYRSLFEDSPISLWEEDFSDVKRHIDSLRASGVQDFRSYFEARPEEVVNCAAMVKIVDVNEVTLELYQAGSKEELMDDLNAVFSEEAKDTFREELIAIAEGKTVFQGDTANRTLGGDRNHIRLKWSVAPGHEDTLAKVLVSVIDITDRVRMVERLRESEERYRTLFEQANDAIHVDNENDEIVDANHRACEMMGYSREELLTMRVTDLQAPELRGQAGSVVKDEVARHGNASFEGLNVHRDGTRIPVEVSVSRVTGLEGDLYISIVRDITERVRAEEALRQRNRELTLLNHAGRAFTSTLDLDQVLSTVLEEACRLLDVVAHSVWLIEPGMDTQEGELVCRQVSGPQSEIVRGWRLALGEGIAGWVARSGESVIVPDTRADGRHFKKVDQRIGLEMRSILSVPLRIKGDVVGVLQMTDSEVDRFDTSDLTLIESLATTAAIAIENARLYEQVRRDAETKATLLREVNHRVQNNLTAIIGLLEIERDHSGIDNQATYQAVMGDLASRIQGLAATHRLLSATKWSPILLSELAEQIIDSAMKALPLDKYVSVQVSPSPVRVAPQYANELALVINELATNSVKYAWPERQTGHIAVRIELEEGPESAGTVVFEFRDDGPGYPEEVLRLERHNVGWDLIQSIVCLGLRGELTLHNDQGAVTTIRFKSLH